MLEQILLSNLELPQCFSCVGTKHALCLPDLNVFDYRK